ncbi:hypothetical protein PENSPDRAFT_756068 [Peniophora sp. CONT]|nr:hypothetical protein PENSPDRAFT_756068 [Peniophora sp. CONT]
MSASPSTQTTLLKFRSSSLLRNTLYDAHTGDLAFRLMGGYTYPTIAVDHGGIIGVKNTCVRRPTTFILDAEGANVAHVQWRGDFAVNIWIKGRIISVPNLCSDPGEATSLEDSQSGEGEEGSMEGVSEESVLFPWTLKEEMRGTWTADDEHIVLLDATGSQLAIYTPADEVTQGRAGCGLLTLEVAGDELTMTVATFLAMEAARRKAFNLGPLDTTSTPKPKSKSSGRRNLLKIFNSLARRVSLRHTRSQSSRSSGSSWFFSSSQTTHNSE